MRSTTLLLYLLSLSPLVLSSGSTSNTKTNPGFTLMLSLTEWNIRRIASWSGGGGKHATVPKGSFWPFEGREIGGGDRKTIFGTKMYGSGYPYGVTNQASVSGRPFPYGVWPLYWGNNYMGSDEYGPALDAIRPGGPVVIVPLENYQGGTLKETYYIVGDQESVIYVTVSMSTWCHATPARPITFNPNSTNPIIRPENIIQYYRASSFALAHLSYNNSAALPSNPHLASNIEGDPLPHDVQISTFRTCVDGAIGNSVPILDAPPKAPMSTGALVGMIVGIVLGTLAITILPQLIPAWLAKWRQRKVDKMAERSAVLQQKQSEAALEQYP